MNPTFPLTIISDNIDPRSDDSRALLALSKQLNQHVPLTLQSPSVDEPTRWQDLTWMNRDAGSLGSLFLRALTDFFDSDTTSPGPIQVHGPLQKRADVFFVSFLHRAWQKVATELGKSHPFKRKKNLESLRSQFMSLLEMRYYRADTHYIAVSHVLKKQLMEQFSIPSDRIRLIHHGVDPEVFHHYSQKETSTETRALCRERFGCSDADHLLLHIETTTSRSGILKSLETLQQMILLGSEHLKLLVVHRGEAKGLEKKITALDLKNQVILTEDLLERSHYYWMADQLFFASDYEPFGLCVLEAMASALPVLVSDSVGAAELIRPGVNGETFKSEHLHDEISDLIFENLKNPERTKQLGLAARETALQNSWTTVAEEYKAFYDELIANNSDFATR